VSLGWRATQTGGQALAKRYPALKKQMNAVKLTVDDAVFEVLDAVSGKSVGTALVRVGWGPESFDSLFSVGDFLICVRDTARVTVYSLSTGEIQSRLFGRYVSASEATGLLAAADGNRLRLYDLKTGTTLGNALPCSFPKNAQFLRGPLGHRWQFFGPFLMSVQSRDFHDLTIPAGRIRRCVGCSTANPQVLRDHLQQFFLAQHRSP
jgi:hypothetical protein